MFDLIKVIIISLVFGLIGGFAIFALIDLSETMSMKISIIGLFVIIGLVLAFILNKTGKEKK